MEDSDQPHISAPLPWETNWYPLRGKPFGYQSPFRLFGNYINLAPSCTNSCAVCSPVPAQTAVQSAALSLHKPHHRDALNRPVATVLFVYHEPHVTTQINVLPVVAATQLHIRQIFSERLGTLRNTNLQRTPGQTVNISAEQLYVMLS